MKFELNLQFFAGIPTVVKVDDVSYHLKEGTITVLSDGLQNNDASTPFWTATPPQGKTFLGVSTMSGASTAEYLVGSIFNVTEVSNNVLYSVYGKVYDNSKYVGEEALDELVIKTKEYVNNLILSAINANY